MYSNYNNSDGLAFALQTILISLVIFVFLQVFGGFPIRSYPSDRTEQAFVATTEEQKQNVNLVFYRRNCPYCQAGKDAVITAAEQSAYPTFFIDVESDEGQVLVKKYGVKKAATIIQLRDGKARSFLYGTVRDGRKTADHRQIATAFDIEKGD